MLLQALSQQTIPGTHTRQILSFNLRDPRMRRQRREAERRMREAIQTFSSQDRILMGPAASPRSLSGLAQVARSALAHPTLRAGMLQVAGGNMASEEARLARTIEALAARMAEDLRREAMEAIRQLEGNKENREN